MVQPHCVVSWQVLCTVIGYGLGPCSQGPDSYCGSSTRHIFQPVVIKLSWKYLSFGKEVVVV